MSVFFVRNTIPLYNGFHVYAKLFERLSFVNMLSLFFPLWCFADSKWDIFNSSVSKNMS